MARCDFVVKYDPKKDSQEELSRRILYSLVISRLRAKKPTVIFVSGESGEGKSFTVLRIQEELCRIQGIDFKEIMHDINVYIPFQYPEKLGALLNKKNERLKKVNILAVHEARELVNAKDWQRFVTQAISSVNAMSRSIKRLCIIITSQFIRDITTDIRYTLNYYVVVRRPKGKRARAYWSVMWKDDRDLEKPKLRKRKVSGYLVYPDGRYRRYVPQYFEFRPPDRELAKEFDKRDTEAKLAIIDRKLQDMLKQMSDDIGVLSKKVEAMVDYYADHPENLSMIGRRYRGAWKLKPEARDMHDLSMAEASEFEEKMQVRLKEGGIVT